VDRGDSGSKNVNKLTARVILVLLCECCLYFIFLTSLSSSITVEITEVVAWGVVIQAGYWTIATNVICFSLAYLIDKSL
jgi:hypothetical protein